MLTDEARFAMARACLEELCARDSHVKVAVQDTLRSFIDVLNVKGSSASHAIQQDPTIIEERVGNFIYTRSEPYHYVNAWGWASLTLPETVTIGEVISLEANIAMGREAKRRKDALFK
jgi:hypothetical protein